VILPTDARVALYYAPRPDDPLWSAGNRWLGRDPLSDAALAQPDLPDLAAITADARRYGFHATLKAPMRLRPGRTWGELLARATGIAAGRRAFALPRLSVMDLEGFLALGLSAPSAPLRAFVDACVAGVDDFRAPPTADERARRRAMRLSPERAAMLQRWGYPDVFETWVFHMTLTRRLTAAEAARYRPAAEQHFAAALDQQRMVQDLCLFVQAAPDAAFTLAARLPLRG
jgi:putative phosphonate metabolism protein